jgi:hypothetical protein
VTRLQCLCKSALIPTALLQHCQIQPAAITSTVAANSSSSSSVQLVPVLCALAGADAGAHRGVVVTFVADPKTVVKTVGIAVAAGGVLCLHEVCVCVYANCECLLCMQQCK